jgi:hypothetical protein
VTTPRRRGTTCVSSRRANDRQLEKQRVGCGFQHCSVRVLYVPNPSLIPSIELFLVYVLRASGCHGRLTAGRVERIGPASINIYDERDAWLEYFSGDALRSWCVLDQHGMPHEDWEAVQPEDLDDLISCALSQHPTD